MTTPAESFATYLDSLANFGIEPSLAGIQALCQALGAPENRLRAVQITGTNGKTSTARMLGEILQAHELSAGVYTSPHLESYLERFLIDRKMLGQAEFEALGTRMRAAVARAEQTFAVDDSRRITQFEALTGTALQAFVDADVDVAVLEVGMGGLWDATSVVDAKVAVITNVTLDHAEWLGPELSDIAAEKAGVLREGSIGVIGVVDQGVAVVLKERAQVVGARLLCAGIDFHLESGPSGHSFHTPGGVYEDLIVGLAGEWQLDNALLATVAAEAMLGRPLDTVALQAALARVTSPGRAEMFPGRPGVLLDGAHNLAGIQALVRHVRSRYHDRPVAIVTAILRDKAALEMATALADLGPLYVVDLDHPRRLPAAELVEALRELGQEAASLGSFEAALDRARQAVGPDGVVVVTGSLYLVGPARALLRGSR